MTNDDATNAADTACGLASAAALALAAYAGCADHPVGLAAYLTIAVFLALLGIERGPTEGDHRA